TIGGLSNAQGGYAVGTQGIGPFTLVQVRNPKPTANVSLTWVKGNHTYKFGGDLVVDSYLNSNRTYAEPWITFSRNQTDNPGNFGLPLTSTAGVSFASFLLGEVDNGFTSIATHTRIGKHSISGFAQDSWKITRKLT